MKSESRGAMLITGSSSGIGRASALLLAREGFQVFAGVRKRTDADSIQAQAGVGLTPVMLDVTDGGSIAAAAAHVSARLDGRGLAGLVNVAGIGMSGPVEYVTSADLHRMFEVNVFGQIAVIQAFMPLIRKARGRIINMGSVVAHIAIPFGGVLSASKSALGSLSDALRLELRPFGIHVCVIEPGSIRTPAMDKTLGDLGGIIRRLPPEGAQRYGDMLRTFTRGAYTREEHGSPPDVVAYPLQGGQGCQAVRSAAAIAAGQCARCAQNADLRPADNSGEAIAPARTVSEKGGSTWRTDQNGPIGQDITRLFVERANAKDAEG
jgi:NAD(P)-dependent dehydrogenase (short-subunit alcohol dehydrogenase family)